MSTHSYLISLSWFWVLFCISGRRVVANTEIINFEASENSDTSVPLQINEWPMLHRDGNTVDWSMLPAPLGTTLHLACEPISILDKDTSPCPYEFWVTLDLDHKEWRRFSKFTLRLSWPASSPADFLLEIYSPEDIMGRLPSRYESSFLSIGKRTRRKYARVRALDAGVPTPNGSHVSVLPYLPDRVPFILLLEPLYLGVLPASVLPILLFLVPIVVFAVLAVPWINGHLASIAKEARLEIDGDQKDK